MKTLSVATTTHGRMLVRDSNDPVAVVVGFHGYMENAAIQMDRLAALPGSEKWKVVSVQGLHRFYRGRSDEVIASWMTRQDRDEMIADNIEYADRVLEAVSITGTPLVTVGFSQGVAMAFRSAIRARNRADAVVAVCGDVPPELLADATARFPAGLLLRGEHDEWYTAARLDADVTALRARGASVTAITYDGGHEWTPAVAAEASTFIAKVCSMADRT